MILVLIVPYVDEFLKLFITENPIKKFMKCVSKIMKKTTKLYEKARESSSF